jgi:hypothetical protein
MRSKFFESLVARIKSEYVEMPGLRLTAEQGSRLWGLERNQCDEVLAALVKRRFLALGEDGKYGRPSDSAHVKLAADVAAVRASVKPGPIAEKPR